MNINMDEIKTYIQALIPTSENWEKELEKYASIHRVPIIEKDGIQFLTQLIRMKQPKRVLEIGTAIGYSALKINEAYPEAKITTIERDDEMVRIANENITKLNKQQHIHVIHGDALEVLKEFQMKDITFDFIFIDAAKGQYKKFFELVQPLISNDVTIVCDNILFKGYVINQSLTEQKRLQKLANKIDLFNHWLMKEETYHTTVLPIGDGMTVSVLK
ncbi:O-methyltransferase [Pseudogracilibacillus sp. SO10305]